ncbi:hypothetical protein A4A49_11401 [Nicotiana attenuata]|uniref:Uncharacterized protein n=1 Tax=Nicotiana attenuata TaxID=49451 RepID=A0A1J6HWC8_NICAT|nr:hypothetical protein A4A49_11401 [Nicotiana attenuata]
MAKSLVSYTTFLALLLCFLLISSTEMQAAQGKLCRRRSKTFSSSCFISKHCDEECKEKEGAKRGMYALGRAYLDVFATVTTSANKHKHQFGVLSCCEKIKRYQFIRIVVNVRK